MTKDIALLIISCDKYSDCWEPFSECMERFWPEFASDMYLCTEIKESNIKG